MEPFFYQVMFVVLCVFKLANSAFDFFFFIPVLGYKDVKFVAQWSLRGPEVPVIGPVQKYLQGWFTLKNFVSNFFLNDDSFSSVSLYASFYLYQPVSLYFQHFALCLNVWTLCMSSSFLSVSHVGLLCPTRPLPVAWTSSRFTCNSFTCILSQNATHSKP